MDDILRDFPYNFDTQRLTIRAPLPGDGQSLNAALVDSWERLRQWMDWAAQPQPPAPEDSEANVRHAHLRFLERKDMRLHLFLKGTGSLIGSSGLHRIKWDVPAFEIGYWVRTGYEGQGYVAEAVEAITAFAFEQLKARRVEIRCDALNQRSAAVARRAGYELEGTLRCESRHHLTGDLRDTLIFSKIRRVEVGDD